MNRRGVVVGLGFALTLAGCSDQARIMEAFGSSESSTLELGVASCNADHQVEVDAGDAQVRVTITVRNDTTDDCADSVRVELDEPLGDRALVDGATGDTVAVQPGGA